MLGRSSLKIRVKLEDLPKQLLEMFVDIANKNPYYSIERVDICYYCDAYKYDENNFDEHDESCIWKKANEVKQSIENVLNKYGD